MAAHWSQAVARSVPGGHAHSYPALRYASSTGCAWWNRYVRPDVCVSRCQMRTGSVAGSVAGASAEPALYTRGAANDGMNLPTGSFSSKAPSSYSIIAATDVIGLVI